MGGEVLISASELSDLMKGEPVVLIDTRDPAIYFRGSHSGCRHGSPPRYICGGLR